MIKYVSAKSAISDYLEEKEFQYERLKKRPLFGTHCRIIFNQLASGTLKEWVHLAKINDILLNNALFQVIVSIHALHKYLKTIHFDLHASNILFDYIEGTLPIISYKNHWLYHINKKNYYVPNMGIRFKLWDFGRSFYQTELNNIAKNLLKNLVRFYPHLIRKNIDSIINRLLINKKYIINGPIILIYGAYFLI